jgi:hypothetical protein
VSRLRLDSAIVYTEDGLRVVSAPEVPRRAQLMTRAHAELLLAALTRDPVTVTVRDPVEVAFGTERV